MPLLVMCLFLSGSMASKELLRGLASDTFAIRPLGWSMMALLLPLLSLFFAFVFLPPTRTIVFDLSENELHVSHSGSAKRAHWYLTFEELTSVQETNSEPRELVVLRGAEQIALCIVPNIKEMNQVAGRFNALVNSQTAG